MIKTDFRRSLFYGMPVILYAGMIFFISSFSDFSEEIPSFSGFDGLLHIIEYYLFGWLIIRWLLSKKKTFVNLYAPFLTILIGVLYGVGDEWHQSFVPGREATLTDVFFDGIGIVAATVTYRATRKRISFIDKFEESIERTFKNEAK